MVNTTKRKLITLFTLVTMILAFCATAFAYVGNSSSMKFHDDDCRMGKKISDANRVEFEDRDEAINEGYVPCKVCKP